MKLSILMVKYTKEFYGGFYHKTWKICLTDIVKMYLQMFLRSL